MTDLNALANRYTLATALNLSEDDRIELITALRGAASSIAERDRRIAHMATSNADDWRWYQNQARQACRALKIPVARELDWED